jgi:hypothetical protein
MRPYRLVAELDHPQPEKFAVLSCDPTQRHPDGGCVATVLSLHLTREDADRAAASSPPAKDAGA